MKRLIVLGLLILSLSVTIDLRPSSIPREKWLFGVVTSTLEPTVKAENDTGEQGSRLAPAVAYAQGRDPKVPTVGEKTHLATMRVRSSQ